MADPSVLEAATSALSVKKAGSTGTVDQYGPALIALVGAVVAVCAAFGYVVPGGVVTAATTVAGLLGGFLIRHQS